MSLRHLPALLLMVVLTTFSTFAQEAAPTFLVPDPEGHTYTLDDCKGAVTVIEWVNFTCPYVRKYYSSGVVPGMQQRWAAHGVRWFSVSSNTAGQPGHLEASRAPTVLKDHSAKPTALLLDADQAMAHAFGVRKTPFVVVLDAQGQIAYRGGFDEELSFDPKRIDPQVNRVSKAVEQVLQGKPVKRARSRAHGCTIR